MTTPVRLRGLHIANFRGITDLALPLEPRGATVLVGENGVGKTSILEALLIALGHHELAGVAKSALREQVRFGAEAFLLTPDVVDYEPFKLSSEWAETATFEPVGEVAYYPARRALTEALRLDDLKAKLVSAYYRGLRGPAPSPQFEAIQRFLRPFLGERWTIDVFPTSNNPGSGDAVILRDGPIPAEVTSLAQARRLAPGRTDLPTLVPLEALSSGQRSLFAFVGPLVFRDEPLDLLLIDEPEMHVHPAWQQRLLGALEALLPDTQIVVATHSPHLLTTVLNRQIRVLDVAGGVTTPELQTMGWDSGEVLPRVMGVDERPDVGPARLVEAYFEAIASNREESPEGQQLLAEIRSHYGANHPVVDDCEATARFAAFRRRQPRRGEP